MAIAKLNAILRATGNAAGFSSGELQDMANSLQGATLYGDELIMEMQSLLLTFRSIRGDVFERTTELALDMAAVFGSTAGSAVQLGKALEDPIHGITALARVGVTFNETQKQTIEDMVEAGRIAEAQGLILDVLAGQVGGTARAMAEGPMAAAKQLANELGDLKEAVGLAIGKMMEPGTRALTAWVRENKQTIAGIFANLPDVAAIAWEAVVHIMDTAMSPEILQRIMDRIWVYMVASVAAGGQAAQDTLGALWDGMVASAQQVGENWTKNLINGIVQGVTMGDSPPWVRKLLGIDPDWEGVQPFKIEPIDWGSVFSTGLGTALSEMKDAFAQEFQSMLAIIGGAGGELGEGLGKELAPYLARIQAIIDSWAAAKSAADGAKPSVEGLNDALSGKSMDPEEYEKLIAGLERQAVLFGASEAQIIAYDLALKGATKDQIDNAVAWASLIQELKMWDDIMKESTSLTERMMTNDEKYAAGVAHLDALLALGEGRGGITLETRNRAIKELYDTVYMAGVATFDFAKAMEDLDDRLTRAGLDASMDAFYQLGLVFGEGSERALDFADAVANIGLSIMKMLPSLMIEAGLKAIIAGQWGLGLALILAGGGAAIFGGYAQGQYNEATEKYNEATETGNAHGNVYEEDNIIPFHRGSLFPREIANTPTRFRFARGTGVYGEAGIEAIMPVTRMPSGDLGVRAVGSDVVVSMPITIHNYSTEQVKTREVTGPGGELVTEIIIGTVKAEYARGGFDKLNAALYGSRRQAVRVG